MRSPTPLSPHPPPRLKLAPVTAPVSLKLLPSMSTTLAIRFPPLSLLIQMTSCSMRSTFLTLQVLTTPLTILLPAFMISTSSTLHMTYVDSFYPHIWRVPGPIYSRIASISRVFPSPMLPLLKF